MAKEEKEQQETTADAPDKLGLVKKWLPWILGNLGIVVCSVVLSMIFFRSPTPAPLDGEQTLPVSRNEEVEPAPPVSKQLERADMFFREGDAVSASKIYEKLLANDDDSQVPQIEFRKALSAEVLGDFTNAISSYRKAADSTTNRPFIVAAQMGQARSWAKLDRIDLAKSLLYKILLTSGSNESSRADAFFLLGKVLVSGSYPIETDLLDPKGILLSDMTPTIDEFQRIVTLPKEPETKDEPDKPARSGLSEIHLIDETGNSVRDKYVSANVEQQPTVEVIAQLCKVSKIGAFWTESAVNRLTGRNTRMTFDEMNLTNVLDAVLEPAGLVWTSMPRGIRISEEHEIPRGQLKQLRKRQSVRVLDNTLTLFPDHPRVAAVAHSLGNIAFLEEQFDDAIGRYNTVIRSSTRENEQMAATFNLAKTYLQLRDFDAANDAMYEVVDHGKGQSLEPVGFLHLGKSFLESERISKSIRPLVRALSLSKSIEYRPHAAITLATAYLLDGKPEAANMIIVENKEDIKLGGIEEQGVFISALARFRIVQESLPRVRAGRTLTNSMAQVEPGEFFSAAGYLLVGQAFEEIGMPNQMSRVYTTALSELPDIPIRDRMKYLLAIHANASNNLEFGSKLLNELISDEGGIWGRKANFHLASVAYQRKDYADCIRRCADFLPLLEDNEEKVEALRLMGRAYQNQNMFYEAAICFSGSMPVSNNR